MFDGVNTFSFFSKSPEQLFEKLFSQKYEFYQIYAHNLARFDNIFIFKYLGRFHKKYNFSIISRNGLIIMIKITSKKDHISLTIKDSFLLLPSSLAKLSKNFNTDIQKGMEAVLIEDITNTPGSDFYIMNDISHYSKEVLKLNNFIEWRDLIRKYCESDCISLYQILINFRKLIFDNFSILIDKYPTTPSLAFAVFRSKYLKDGTIPIINGEIDEFIRGSFTGGSTEMIIPYGENIYVYDVNSLYPFQMANQEFPIGKINRFIDLNEVPENNLWFGKAIVTSKTDMHIPYLQIHRNRTISPNGTFGMIITSAEYYNALKDYNIQILGGYHFKGGNLFYDYVTDIYKLRMNYPKSHPLNYIAKLLMNSLYGRFGMKDILVESKFADSKVVRETTVLTSIKLDEDLFFIETEKERDEADTNVGIASLITSYSRIHMQKIKQYCINNNIKIYYFDTDSIFTSDPLPDHFISNELGKLKLEYIFKEAVFLGPKIYGGITNEGDYICKIKGYKDSKKVSFLAMKSLLNEGASLNLNHIKWFRSLGLASIGLVNTKYKLTPTQNKRSLVFKNGIALDTNPFKVGVNTLGTDFNPIKIG